jgi:anti-sigma regulatory factor (Ser/Thr protein kinase)
VFVRTRAGKSRTVRVENDNRRIERQFPQRDRSAPRAARAAVACIDGIADGVRCDLTLVVSELVANAVRHAPAVAGGEVRLLIHRRDGHIHVEVCDPGGGFDPTPDPTREGGLGLVTVSRVAREWGIQGGDHTTVWCNLASV